MLIQMVITSGDHMTS